MTSKPIAHTRTCDEDDFLSKHLGQLLNRQPLSPKRTHSLPKADDAPQTGFSPLHMTPSSSFQWNSTESPTSGNRATPRAAEMAPILQCDQIINSFFSPGASDGNLSVSSLSRSSSSESNQTGQRASHTVSRFSQSMASSDNDSTQSHSDSALLRQNSFRSCSTTSAITTPTSETSSNSSQDNLDELNWRLSKANVSSQNDQSTATPRGTLQRGKRELQNATTSLNLMAITGAEQETQTTTHNIQICSPEKDVAKQRVISMQSAQFQTGNVIDPPESCRGGKSIYSSMVTKRRSTTVRHPSPAKQNTPPNRSGSIRLVAKNDDGRSFVFVSRPMDASDSRNVHDISSRVLNA